MSFNKRIGFSILKLPVVNSIASWVYFGLRRLGIPFGDFVFPDKGLLRVRSLPDREFVMWNNGKDTIASRLKRDGLDGFEPELRPVLMKLVPEAQVFLDIGANTGLYSLFAASANPSCEVHAFEPVPDIRGSFEENLRRNNFPQVRAWSEALSSCTRMGEFLIPEEIRYSTGGTELDDSSTKYNRIPVQFLKLDEFVEKVSLNKIDLIKMDTEKTEHLVIEGGLNSIQRFRPVMIVEVLNDDIGAKIEKLLSGLNYSMFQICREGLKPLNSLQVGTSRGSEWNFLFMPAEKAGTVSDLKV